MNRREFLIASSGMLTAFRPCVLAEEKAQAASRYLDIVRRYADAMIEHGRDVYGEVKSPLFAATLDRKTLKLPEKPPGNISGIRNGDRTLTGANPMHDENLYQVLYALTKATGEMRYAAEADAALKWFFEHCQSPKGLMAWGEHQGWDFVKEASTAPAAPHEFYRPWVLWDRCFALAPEPCHRFATGLWNHQIADHKTGAFSRHAMDIWDTAKTSARKGYEFPRHGGFYIATWAAACERTKDPEMLKAIECLVDSFEARRNKTTGIIPAESNTPELVWPQSNVSLAMDLHDGAKRVPVPLAKKMRACAERIDGTFLAIKHDLAPDGNGFLKAVRASTLEPTDTYTARGIKKPGKKDSWTHTWETGYGESTDAQVAMLCLSRWQQVKLDGYRTLFLAAADRYLRRDPDLAITLYPGALADAIAVMVAAYRLTRDAKFLDRADVFAKTALDVFFEDGSPLPRASSKHSHYETITRGDTLAMVLLDLWAARAKPSLDLNMVWDDR
ncbi:MAG: hypothetical protein HZC54_21950 [Verrucomicrobia bacterium]|nr:hypothetical protein [Verrucomicrobiota bacterium]